MENFLPLRSSKRCNLDPGRWNSANVYFVRHAQSEGDLRSDVWEGSTDSQLTPLGHQQAGALAHFFTEDPGKIHYIYYAPESIRTCITALRIWEKQAGKNHNPQLIMNHNLKDQNFGKAEGQKRYHSLAGDLKQLFAQERYPPLPSHLSFPDGESYDSLKERAKEGLINCAFENLAEKMPSIVIVSSQAVISEMLKFLFELSSCTFLGHVIDDMENTAWTQVKISVQNDYLGLIEKIPERKLRVNVGKFNRRDHLFFLSYPKLEEEHESHDSEESSVISDLFGDNRDARPGFRSRIKSLFPSWSQRFGRKKNLEGSNGGMYRVGAPIPLLTRSKSVAYEGRLRVPYNEEKIRHWKSTIVEDK